LVGLNGGSGSGGPYSSLSTVTNPAYGTNCPNATDPTGVNDSTCAITAAITAINAYATANPGRGRPPLFFPPGSYTVGSGSLSCTSTSCPALFTLLSCQQVIGSSVSDTIINSYAANNTLFLWNSTPNGYNSPGQCQSGFFNITLHNSSPTTIQQGGNAAAVEVLNVQNFFAQYFVIDNFIGPGILFQGGTERSLIQDGDFNDFWTTAVKTSGDSNEVYFDRLNLQFPANYSRQNPNGYYAGGTIYPDYVPAASLYGVNVHWQNSSIKGTIRAGIRLGHEEATTIEHSYIENPGAPISLNPAIQISGFAELGHITSALTTTTLLVPVDDAIYQPLYLSDPALAASACCHAGTQNYQIFPLDYSYGDLTDLSAYQPASGPAIYRGTIEGVAVNAFAADGAGHLSARGTTAYAWPANSIIEQTPNSGYAQALLLQDHVQSVVSPVSGTATRSGLTYTAACNDTTPKTTWVGNPMYACGEIFAGVYPDGYGIQFPSQHFVGIGNQIDMSGVSQYFNSAGTGQTNLQVATAGQGIIKIGANAQIRIYDGTTSIGASSPDNTYLNFNPINHTTFVNWGSSLTSPIWSLGSVSDYSGNTFNEPSAGIFSQLNASNGPGLQQYYFGKYCANTMPAAGSSTPTTPLATSCTDQYGNWSVSTYPSGTAVNQLGITSNGVLTGAIGTQVAMQNASNTFTQSQNINGVGIGQMQNILEFSSNFSGSAWSYPAGAPTITAGQTDPWNGTTASNIAIPASTFILLTNTTSYTLTPGLTYNLCYLAYASISGATASMNVGNGGGPTSQPLAYGAYPASPTCINLTAGSSTHQAVNLGFIANSSAYTVTLAAIWVVPTGVGIAYHPTAGTPDSTPVTALVVGGTAVTVP
jgi:hypothetical protein